jgi:alpha-glucosidase
MKLFRAFLLLSALSCATPSARAEIVSAGNIVSISTDSNGVDFVLSSGAAARVDFVDPAIARVRVNPSGALSSRISPAITTQALLPPNPVITQSGNSVRLVTTEMVVNVSSPFRVSAWQADGTLMTQDETNAVSWDNQTYEIYDVRTHSPGEHFFGLGLFGGPIDRTGRSLTLRNTDNSAYTEFTDPLYQSYPFYYGLMAGEAYGVFLDNPAFPFFDMDSGTNGTVIFGAETNELNYYLIAGPQPFNVANNYSRLTGFNQLPPEWSLGYHHSHYGWTNEAEIMNIATNMRAMNFPCDSLWFDILYMDQQHQFTWDPTNFPDPLGFNNSLGALGFQRVYINEPCLLQTDPLWSFLDASGYFLTDGTGKTFVDTIWFGDVSFLDFTRNDLRAWYEQQLGTFLSTGISGLWLDLNEPADNFMPQAVYNFNGDPRPDLEGRNVYALEEAATAYAAELQLRPNVRPWNFSRSGYSGMQRYSHNWAGDAPSTFDALQTAIQMSISMGLSGQNQFGHDTGGFLGSPDGELFTRWLEFSCFTPLFRNHSTDTSAPREPWSFGEPYTSLIRQIIYRRYQFLPYTYSLFEEASRTGRPVLAPTFFYAPGDTNTFNQDSVYLFGPNLLVAPVFVEGSSNRSVYLPYGSDWINFWTDQRYAGGQTVVVSSPLGQTPLFARAGTILVRGAGMSYVGASADPTLSLDIYPEGTSSFTLYEDDGSSFNYQGGAYLRTQIDCNWNHTAGQISIARVAGSYQPPGRDWSVAIHGISVAPASVLLNGAALDEADSPTNLESAGEGWFYDSTNSVLQLRVADSATLLELTVSAPPVIVTQTSNQTIASGGSVSFSVTVGGSTPLSYQWIFDATNQLEGQTNATLTLSNVPPSGGGYYSLIVSNTMGGATNIPALLSVLCGIDLSLQPGATTASLSFSALPQTSYTLEYLSTLATAQWQRLTNVPPQAGTNALHFSDPGVIITPQRFYRLVSPAQ